MSNITFILMIKVSVRRVQAAVLRNVGPKNACSYSEEWNNRETEKKSWQITINFNKVSSHFANSEENIERFLTPSVHTYTFDCPYECTDSIPRNLPAPTYSTNLLTSSTVLFILNCKFWTIFILHLTTNLALNFTACRLPCNQRSKWIWVAEEIRSYGNRLRSTHSESSFYWRLVYFYSIIL